MSVRSKAAFQTAKALVIGFFTFAVLYLLLDLLGPKFGIAFLLLSMIGGFTWLIYDYYVHKFTWEEKFKD